MSQDVSIPTVTQPTVVTLQEAGEDKGYPEPWLSEGAEQSRRKPHSLSSTGWLYDAGQDPQHLQTLTAAGWTHRVHTA